MKFSLVDLIIKMTIWAHIKVNIVDVSRDKCFKNHHGDKKNSILILNIAVTSKAEASMAAYEYRLEAVDDTKYHPLWCGERGQRLIIYHVKAYRIMSAALSKYFSTTPAAEYWFAFNNTFILCFSYIYTSSAFAGKVFFIMKANGKFVSNRSKWCRSTIGDNIDLVNE